MLKELVLTRAVEEPTHQNHYARSAWYAGYGIRTRELLRDRILSPAPLASLANPANTNLISNIARWINSFPAGAKKIKEAFWFLVSL